MRPLYDSFKQATSGNQERQEFSSKVFQWVQNSLSLANLRKGFLEALRKISKHTSIMNSPEQLQQEARSKVTDHCIGMKSKVVPTILTPPTTPRAPTPAPGSSAKCTPVQTPTPTPPRTPTVSRRSSKREIQRSTESRSRSNSPAPEETKPKRRSNYRSRSGRRSGEEQEVKMEYGSPVGNPNLPLLSQLLTSPQLMQTSQYGAVTRTTASDSTSMVSSLPNSSMETRISTGQVKTTEDQLITTFVESLISSMNSDLDLPKPEPRISFTTAELSSVFVSTSVETCQSGSANLTESPSQYMNDNSELMKMEVFDTPSGDRFIPVYSSGIISNGSLILPDEHLTCEPIPDLFASSEISEFQPMDLLTSTASSDNLLTGMSSFASVMSEPASGGVYSQSLMNCVSETSANVTGTVNSHLLNPDEDSLTDLLSLDVMDVNSVMKFFNDEKPTHL
ncbi:putative uncharacterized protein DDB_G0290521 [Mercenaria mercenaria]|uniref:putative uncharacterized protein DDB_G0290521 n=1 Tax=Mercenaria mercenaria TaxID=6596 RepID=UPI00234F2011|nr:putative uncharacterized protein DDB_G0290521 [Mercenaria mercenaria]